MPLCPNCGTPNPEAARFCMSCGLALPGAAEAAREARKVVTVVFADIVGSTTFGEHQDPEIVRAVMGRWFDAMRGVVEHHGGTVEKFIGDAVVALFGVPLLHEDDALRAARAAVDMHQALGKLNEELRQARGLELQMRVGVNTGAVIVGEPRAGGGRATGDAVNVAARLQTAAEPGQTLVGDSTWRLIRDAVETGESRELSVKGRAEPVIVRTLVAVRQGAEAIQRRSDSPMVGRARELQILRSAFERALTGERTVMVTVLGSAGVGKSRLVSEFQQEVRDRAMVLTGRCLPYGQGITWNPIVELLRSAFDLDDNAPGIAVATAIRERMAGSPDTDAILARLADLLSLPASPAMPQARTTPWPVEEIAWAIRRFVEWMAADRPHVVVMDDLQWAEPSLLDLLEQIAEWVHGLPVLLVSMARPELLDTRPGWGGGKPDSTTFVLEPLPASETEALIDALLAGGSVDPAARSRIAAAAEGNPLFVEQLIEMLLDDGVIRRADDGTSLVVAELDRLDVPPTIQALLAARLDRLSEPERRTIERAAVVGKEFGQREVSELTPEGGRAAVGTQLLALVRKELIRPERRRDDGAATFRFRHLLIRDAAYDSLPKAERADLHERFADWLEHTAGDRLAELDEIAGYHLEQARAYRLELGPDDARTRSLALRAGHRLAAAGRRAADREEGPVAANLLGRSAALLVEEPARRFDALMTMLQFGVLDDLTRARQVAGQAEEVAAALGQIQLRRARLMTSMVRVNTDPSFEVSTLRAEVAEALAAFTAAGDVDGVLDAHAAEATIELNAARWRETAAAARRGLDAAVAAGRDQRRETFAGLLSNALLWGPEHASSAIAAVQDLLATTDRRLIRAGMLSVLGVMWAVLDDREAAAAALDESTVIRTDLGIDPGLFRAAYAWYALDDLPEALRVTQTEIANLRRQGETGNQSTMLAFAGLIHAREGRLDEALAAAAEGAAIGQPDDAVTQLVWRSAAGLAHIRAGQPDEADRLTAEATAIADGTDFMDAGTAWIARAEVLLALGRRDEAAAAAGRARDLYGQKGYVNAIRRVDALGLT